MMGACADAVGMEMETLPAMVQTCSVGPYSKDGHTEPKAWQSNKTTMQWLQEEMITCHRMDPANMVATYELLRKEIASSSSRG